MVIIPIGNLTPRRQPHLRHPSVPSGTRDGSTVSHGVRRAERRVNEERGFRQQVEQVLHSLSSARIQA
ncbi:MAG TPA: hypothetical protein VKK81_29105 [Candidatus Binatia bacterium]|nr:hypothetical protein [Candidatus Binatia bacterium]